MLKSLSVQNFALIDSVTLELEEGLTVITGETGAGKSILLGALSLILGSRADHSTLKSKTEKCIIEGAFNIGGYEFESFFEKNDLDYATDTILRREITPQGKSRSFINDTPVTLEILKQLGNGLIDIHSQHQSLQINNADFQLSIIDSLASTDDSLKDYKRNFKEYRECVSQLELVKLQSLEAKKNEDYLNFQFKELEELDLRGGETAELEVEQERFANSEEILSGLSQIQIGLSEGDENAIGQLNSIKRLLENSKKYSPELEQIADRFSSALIELEDISSEVANQSSNFEYNPERHQIVEERLGEIHRLQQKHGLNEAEELLALRNKLEEQLQGISSFESQISSLESQKKKLQDLLVDLATKISKKRKRIIPILEREIQDTLIQLGIPAANLMVEHEALQDFTESGLDSFDFLFSANHGVAPQRIAKTASGGEISRFMLAIKSLLAQYKQLPTILFDEIDTGVSGEIAEKMGEILNKIGDQRQVISITHLPQLAAKGKSHYFVYKEESNGISNTKLRKLKEEERVNELAKMLSGKSITEAAMNNAKELLAQ